MKNRHEAGAAETPAQIIENIDLLMAEAEAMIAGPVAGKSAVRFGELKERLAAARGRLTDAYDSARETIGDAYASTRRNVVAGARYSDDAIRKHPYQSIGIALGVGVLIGVLLKRRND